MKLFRKLTVECMCDCAKTYYQKRKSFRFYSNNELLVFDTLNSVYHHTLYWIVSYPVWIFAHRTFRKCCCVSFFCPRNWITIVSAIVCECVAYTHTHQICQLMDVIINRLPGNVLCRWLFIALLLPRSIVFSFRAFVIIPYLAVVTLVSLVYMLFFLMNSSFISFSFFIHLLLFFCSILLYNLVLPLNFLYFSCLLQLFAYLVLYCAAVFYILICVPFISSSSLSRYRSFRLLFSFVPYATVDYVKEKMPCKMFELLFAFSLITCYHIVKLNKFSCKCKRHRHFNATNLRKNTGKKGVLLVIH